jgi:hypothetical protein
VQNDPALASKIVGFDQLERDLASGDVPNYAHIVSNQCNEMHGRDGRHVPPDCRFDNEQGLIARGDKTIGALVDKIQASPIWSAPGNAAIVITWDGDDGPRRTTGRGCCGFDPKVAILAAGISDDRHQPCPRVTDTPYNHYRCYAPQRMHSASTNISATPPTRPRASSRW